MSLTDLHAILPLLVPATAVILLMLLIAVIRNHGLTVAATLFGLAASLGAVFIASASHPRQVTLLLRLDHVSDFYTGLIYAATIIVCALSYGYLKNKKTVREEYYLFLLTTALACAVLVSSSHFVSMFVGLELLSLSLYILISYPGGTLNIEAGIK